MYVYILKCNDKSYYTGVTNNLERRLAEHKSGEVMSCYTFKRRPVQLMFYQQFQTPKEAIHFEKKVKGWTRAKKEALIAQNWAQLHELAKCKNATSHETLPPWFDSAHHDEPPLTMTFRHPELRHPELRHPERSRRVEGSKGRRVITPTRPMLFE
jgi:putative endonuclease